VFNTGNNSNTPIIGISSSGTGCVIEDCLIDGGGDTPGMNVTVNGFGQQAIGYYTTPDIMFNVTVMRNNICHVEKGLTGTIRTGLMIDNLCHAPVGFDQDFGFEGYPTAGDITGVTIKHNYFTSSDTLGGNPNSGTQVSNWPSGNSGTSSVPILVTGNAYDVAGGHQILLSPNFSSGVIWASFTNNGFTTRGGTGSSSEYPGPSNIVADSGNFNMATPLATTGTPLGGSGFW
jgi:hypothetical protein